MALVSSEGPQEQDIEEERQHQLKQQLMAHESAFNPEGQLRAEYLQELVDHGVDPNTAKLMRNMLSKDYVLANYEDAEVHEAWWLSRVELRKIKTLHPASQDILTGDLREFMLDDATENLQPLSPQQESALNQFLLDVFGRITRGRAGWQQDQMSKTLDVKELRDNDNTDTGGFF